MSQLGMDLIEQRVAQKEVSLSQRNAELETLLEETSDVTKKKKVIQGQPGSMKIQSCHLRRVL